MSIEQIIPWALTIFFGCCTLYFSIKANKRAEYTEVERDSTAMARVMVKLESISDDVKEIKSDNRSMQSELKEFRERLAENEVSIKSMIRRLEKLEANYEKEIKGVIHG